MKKFFIKIKTRYIYYTAYAKYKINIIWNDLKKMIKRYLPLTVFSPLEQFEVNNTFSIFDFNKYNNIDIITTLYTYFTKIFFNFNSFSETLFIITLYNAFILYCFFSSSYFYPYTWLQLFFEKIYSETFKFFIKNAGIASQPLFPSFFVIVISLLQLNIFGMLPFSFTITSHIVITSFYSFSIFFAINFIAIRRHGLSFFNIFLPKGVPFILSPLVIYIEIISYISRVFSLSIRLFANMMAGHALLSIFTSFIFNAIFSNGFSIILSIAGIFLVFSIIFIEFIIAFLQVYVFSTLIALYIKDIHNVDHLSYVKISI